MPDDPIAVSSPKRRSGRQRVKDSAPTPVSPVSPSAGGVSRSVAVLVESLGDLKPEQLVLAAAVEALASELDAGAGMAAAAAVRELRAAMAELVSGSSDVVDDFSKWEANLGTA